MYTVESGALVAAIEHPDGTVVEYTCSSVQIRWLQDRVSEIDETILRHARTRGGAWSRSRVQKAWVEIERGGLRPRAEHFTAPFLDAWTEKPDDYIWLAGAVDVALLVAEIGNCPATARLLQRSLPPYVESFVFVGGCVTVAGAATWAVGVLAEALGELDQAIELHQKGLTVHRRMQLPPYIALSQAELAAASHGGRAPEMRLGQAASCSSRGLFRRGAMGTTASSAGWGIRPAKERVPEGPSFTGRCCGCEPHSSAAQDRPCPRQSWIRCTLAVAGSPARGSSSTRRKTSRSRCARRAAGPRRRGPRPHRLRTHIRGSTPGLEPRRWTPQMPPGTRPAQRVAVGECEELLPRRSARPWDSAAGSRRLGDCPKTCSQGGATRGSRIRSAGCRACILSSVLTCRRRSRPVPAVAIDLSHQCAGRCRHSTLLYRILG